MVLWKMLGFSNDMEQAAVFSWGSDRYPTVCMSHKLRASKSGYLRFQITRNLFTAGYWGSGVMTCSVRYEGLLAHHSRHRCDMGTNQKINGDLSYSLVFLGSQNHEFRDIPNCSYVLILLVFEAKKIMDYTISEVYIINRVISFLYLN